MRQFRITFRQEVIVEAKTKQEAEQIFQDLDLDDLKNELGNGVIKDTSFVEEISFEEQE
jgi:hypothetical protein|tara:strand:+ start:180 stop:356 length:177 start_codon:yes stop_codon:yes gene_type:complete